MLEIPDMVANGTSAVLYLGNLRQRDFLPITALDLKASNPRWSPNGRFLYFLVSRAGLQQVWRMSVSDHTMEAVTAFPLDIDSFEVDPQGRFLVLSAAVFPGKTPEQTKTQRQDKKKAAGSGRLYDRLMVRQWDEWRGGTRNHLFVYDLAEGTHRDLMKDMDADCPSRPFGGTDDFTISPDGKRIIFSAKDEGLKEAWSTNFDLFMAPIDGADAPKRITSNLAADLQPRFSPDGKTLAYLATRRPGHEADRFQIMLRDMASGKETAFDLRADDSPTGDRSPDSLVWSLDGRRLYLTADHLGHHALFVLDINTGRSSLFMKTGSVTSPRPLADGRVLFGWSSLQRPMEFYLAGLDGGDNRRVTKMNDDQMEEIRMGKTAAFSFKGTGGHTVWGRLIYPADFDMNRKYPVVFLIHGGPQTSNLNEFNYRWNPQIFAGAGYAVVAIDYPGSTGYGQDFADAVRSDWGGAAYKGLMAGLSFALDQYPFLDRERLGALGPSFGGYMVNWIAGHEHPFRCFVSHAGIFDRDKFFYQTDELWFAEWEAGGLPWINPEGHKRHNPADLVGSWKTPTLIIHGERDFRVPFTQGLSAFTALQRKGVPSKLLAFPDEGHWILKPQNALQWYRTVLSWLDQWLVPQDKKRP